MLKILALAVSRNHFAEYFIEIILKYKHIIVITHSLFTDSGGSRIIFIAVIIE